MERNLLGACFENKICARKAHVFFSFFNLIKKQISCFQELKSQISVSRATKLRKTYIGSDASANCISKGLFFCLCLLGLVIKLNFDIWKGTYWEHASKTKFAPVKHMFFFSFFNLIKKQISCFQELKSQISVSRATKLRKTYIGSNASANCISKGLFFWHYCGVKYTKRKYTVFTIIWDLFYFRNEQNSNR